MTSIIENRFTPRNRRSKDRRLYSKQIMQRASGKSPIALQLRQEVGFRCPIPDCDEFILTYHHFDPPWSEKQHNNPEGMIALCPTCHEKAEGGHWTKQYLHRLKRELQQNPNKQNWQGTLPQPSAKTKPLLQLGTAFASDSPILLAISVVPIIWQRISDNGIPLFSMRIFDEQDKSLLAIDDNSVSADCLSLWDIHFTKAKPELGRRLVVRMKRPERRNSSIILDIRVERLHPDTSFIERLKSIPEVNPPEWPRKQKAVMTNTSNTTSPPWYKSIMDYAKTHCLDEDNNVFLITILRARLSARGRRILIRNGQPLTSEGVIMGRGISSGNGECAYSLQGKQALLKKRGVVSQGTFNMNIAKILWREKRISEQRNQQDVEHLDELYASACRLHPASMSLAPLLFYIDDQYMQSQKNEIIQAYWKELGTDH